MEPLASTSTLSPSAANVNSSQLKSEIEVLSSKNVATIEISFLLAYFTESVKQGTERKSSKGKVDKKIKQQAKVSKDASDPENSLILLEVGSSRFNGRIDYTLIPNEISYWIDIKCWDKVVKIYTSDREYGLKAVSRDSLNWVSFRVLHFIQPTIPSLTRLLEGIVTFNIWPNINKMSSRAKNDIPKQFYVDCSDPLYSLPNTFVKVVERPGVGPGPDYENIQESIVNECFAKAISLLISPVSMVIIGPSPKHTTSIISTIEDVTSKVLETSWETQECVEGTNNRIIESSEEECVSQADNTHPDLITNEEEKSDNKPKIIENIKFSLFAESLFTGIPETSCFVKKPTPELPFLSATISVTNLINEEMKSDLNLLAIKVKKLRNVPVEILKKNSITSLYLTYKILNFNRSYTECKDLDIEVNFNSSRAFDIKHCDLSKLLQYMQTERLIIELYGIKKFDDEPIRHKLFGSEVCDINGNNFKQPMPWSRSYRCWAMKATEDRLYQKAVKLATAGFDLCCLVDGICLKVVKPLLNPESARYLYPLSEDSYVAPEDYGSINVDVGIRHQDSLSPLTDNILRDFSTELEIELDIGAPLSLKLQTLMLSPVVYSRLYLELTDYEVASTILGEICAINKFTMGKILPITDYQQAMDAYYKDMSKMYDKPTAFLRRVPSRKSKQNTALSEGTLQKLGEPAPITGFLIDSVNKVLILIEGLIHSRLQMLLQIAMTLNKRKGRVLYNSDLIFNERLYSPFLTFANGFMIITLKQSLDYILSQKDIFNPGKVPIQAARALKKCQLLMNSNIIRNICQDHLLPSPNELLSLDLEFGIPTNSDELYDSASEESVERAEICRLPRLKF